MHSCDIPHILVGQMEGEFAYDMETHADSLEMGLFNTSPQKTPAH